MHRLLQLHRLDGTAAKHKTPEIYLTCLAQHILVSVHVKMYAIRDSQALSSVILSSSPAGALQLPQRYKSHGRGENKKNKQHPCDMQYKFLSLSPRAGDCSKYAVRNHMCPTAPTGGLKGPEAPQCCTFVLMCWFAQSQR